MTATDTGWHPAARVRHPEAYRRGRGCWPGVARRPGARADGLTLIEALIGLAILAVLVSLALPSFGRQSARSRLLGAAEQLALDINEARHDAAQGGQTLHLRFGTGAEGAWCYAVSASPACTCGQPEACQRRHVTAGRNGRGVHLEPHGAMHFDPAGAAQASAVSVMMSTDWGDRLRVTQTPLGRARVCAPETPFAGRPRC